MSFKRNELTPESINEKKFSGKKALVIFTNIADNLNSKTLSIIQDILTNSKIKSFNCNLLARNIDLHIKKCDFIILLTSPYNREKLYELDEQVNTNELAKVSNSKKIIRINTTKHSEQPQFEGINFIETITIPDQNSCDIREFLKIQLQIVTT